MIPIKLVKGYWAFLLYPNRPRVPPWLTQCPNLPNAAGRTTSLLLTTKANVRFYSQGKYTRLFHSSKPPDTPHWRDTPRPPTPTHRTSTQNHRCCRTKNLPLNFHHTGLDRTGLSDIQIRVHDDFTQSNSFKRKRSSNDRALVLGRVRGATHQCQATRVEELTGRSKRLIEPTGFDRVEQSQSRFDSCRLMLKSVL